MSASASKTHGDAHQNSPPPPVGEHRLSTASDVLLKLAHAAQRLLEFHLGENKLSVPLRDLPDVREKNGLVDHVQDIESALDQLLQFINLHVSYLLHHSECIESRAW